MQNDCASSILLCAIEYKRLMEKEIIQHKTDLLLATVLLDNSNRKLYIDWSINLLQLGIENPYLYILAGFDEDDRCDNGIENYFQKAAEKLNINTNRTHEELLRILIDDISTQVLSGKAEPLRALHLIESVRINYNTDFYPNFIYLAEDVANLEYGERAFFYHGLTIENLDKTIIEEFRLARLCNLDNLKPYDLIYCRQCKHLSNAIHIQSQFFREKQIWKCEKCNSQNILSWSDTNNRKHILEILEQGEKKI